MGKWAPPQFERYPLSFPAEFHPFPGRNPHASSADGASVQNHPVHCVLDRIDFICHNGKFASLIFGSHRAIDIA